MDVRSTGRVGDGCGLWVRSELGVVVGSGVINKMSWDLNTVEGI